MKSSLKDAWSHSLKIGSAVNRMLLENEEADKILKKHFSTLTAENSMKFGPIHGKENVWDWDETDFIANYARNNGLSMRGHVIVWHNQNPQWLFLDGNEPVSKSKLLKRLEDHIFTLAKRYDDIVYAWDVVNEAIDVDKGDENNFRLTDWYKICGKEIYEFAFKRIREVCPNAKLFYNDYNNESGAKLEASLKFLSSLLDSGTPIDGIGIQGHWYYNFPDQKTLCKAVERYSALGLEVEFTEVDVSIYEWSEARDKSEFFVDKPEDRMEEQARRFMEIFSVAADYPSVKGITTWGVADDNTWLDFFPVHGRKNWPLLFDENYREKKIVNELIKLGIERKK